jgi:hypothetical protein
MCNENKAIQKPEQVVVVENQLKHHEAFLAVITFTNLKSKTFHDIKQYHKFTPDKKRNIICAYSDSTQTEYKHKYCPKQVVPLDDILV